MKLTRFLLFLFAFGYINTAHSEWNQTAINEFIVRIVADKAPNFIAQQIPSEQGKDVFELESRNGKIILRGNNGVSVASALNFYLTNYCHCQITWNGTNLQMPVLLPVIKGKIHKLTPYHYRYYLNYCTFNYSMAWWDWSRWQKEIDWMALNGINMPLALTGEEAIWKKVYHSMGFTDDQLDKFFSGPAYFSWFWMGNLDAWGGPLPQHWMDTHEALQKKILEAERSLGMTPVLPAFTGHVPASFQEKFPNAKVKKTNWGAGFDDVYILDPSDPMFETIGKAFLAAQKKEYGTDHLYSADTFNENLPPSNDSAYLDDMSKKIFAPMKEMDPEAIWVMQGWMFHFDSSFWRPTQTRALLNAVPDNHMIILDLYSESYPMWDKTNAYYGKPWIWNMLNNFGGNISLWGRMKQPAHDPATVLQDPASGKMVGIGLAPEAIEQNPALYQLMLANTWTNQPINLSSWLKLYAWDRYGKQDPDIDKAWTLLAGSVYNGGLSEGGPESILTGRPTLDSETEWTRTPLDYDPSKLVAAWDLFAGSAPDLKSSDGFQYDLVDITRQVLADYADPLQQKFAKAFKDKDLVAFKKYSSEFLALMDDMNTLLNTRKDFLLGKWLEDARANGITPAEKNLYEFTARDLITLWGKKNCKLHEYSCRQWAGLISGFYKPRWEQFIAYLTSCLETNTQPDFKKFKTGIIDWEWNWVNSHESYSSRPVGNPVSVSLALYKKYSPAVHKAL